MEFSAANLDLNLYSTFNFASQQKLASYITRSLSQTLPEAAKTSICKKVTVFYDKIIEL
jgi:hypothetical protein